MRKLLRQVVAVALSGGAAACTNDNFPTWESTPARVAQVSAQPGLGSVIISWTAASDALQYSVYYATEEGVGPDTYRSLQGGNAETVEGQSIAVDMLDHPDETLFAVVVNESNLGEAEPSAWVASTALGQSIGDPIAVEAPTGSTLWGARLSSALCWDSETPIVLVSEDRTEEDEAAWLDGGALGAATPFDHPDNTLSIEPPVIYRQADGRCLVSRIKGAFIFEHKVLGTQPSEESSVDDIPWEFVPFATAVSNIPFAGKNGSSLVVSGERSDSVDAIDLESVTRLPFQMPPQALGDNDLYGISAATIDLDDDGDLDLGVGAASANGQGWVDLITSDGEILQTLPLRDGNFGGLMDATGDFNGDGIRDLLVGAPGTQQLFTFAGDSDGNGVAPEPTWSIQLALPRTANYMRFRTGVAVVDTNRDGYDDVFVGDRFFPEQTIASGRVLLFLGGQDGLGAHPFWASAPRSDGANLGAALTAFPWTHNDIPGTRLVVGAPTAFWADAPDTGSVLVYDIPEDIEQGRSISLSTTLSIAIGDTVSLAELLPQWTGDAADECTVSWGDGYTRTIAPCDEEVLTTEGADVTHRYAGLGVYDVRIEALTAGERLTAITTVTVQ